MTRTTRDATPGRAHARPAAEVLAELGTDPATGLTAADAGRRAARFGPNVLPSTGPPSRLRILLGQVRNPLIYVLLTAGVVTAAVGGYVDAGVIGGVVVLNALIGYVQESRAERALAALAGLVRTTTTVVRDGATAVVDAAVLVPGDVVVLAAGDRVPADLRLIETHEFRADESALTGESVPVTKSPEPVEAASPVADRTAMAFSGTLVTNGTARAVVVATGTATQLGLVGTLVAETEPVVTPLTRKLGGFARRLSVLIVAVAAVTFALGLVRGTPAAEMFTAAVALAVGAIPEGLPAAVSIALAIGVVRMARRNTVVRTLPSVETLGATTVICADKTGTLTHNRMTVTAVTAAGHLAEPADVTSGPLASVLRAGVLCSDAAVAPDGEATGDPTETALIDAAVRAGFDPVATRAAAPRTDVLAFDTARRMMATVHSGAGGPRCWVKGAVEDVLARCTTAFAEDGSVVPVDLAAVAAHHHDLMAGGARVLAFATFTPAAADRGDAALAARLDRGGLTFLGLQAMHDPPRAAAAAAVRACRKAGIAVKMITGDHPGTAGAVAHAVGVLDERDQQVLTGAQLDGLTEQELAVAADRTAVFARVSPAQKLRLVTALQQRGHIVAMTGDGVNDAPALRKADIGVAMGRGGTDAAREAADMVLTDDDFASIEAAVEEGRGVFDNLRKFLAWTVPTNIAEGVVVLAAVVLGIALPIVPVQILWINMTTAVFLGLSLAFEPKEPGIMDRPPRAPNRSLVTGRLLRQVVVVSAVLVAAAFACHGWELASGGSVAVARTVAVNVFVCVQIAYLVSCRDLRRPVLAGVRAGRNPMVWVGIGITLVLQAALTYAPVMRAMFHTAPIGAGAWLRVLGVAVLAFALLEFEKWVWRHDDP